VLPVFFDGANGPLFQLLGAVHPALRTAMLPHEVLNKRGKQLEVRIGNAISFEALSARWTDSEMITYLRRRTHVLRHRQSKEQSTVPNVERYGWRRLKQRAEAPARLAVRLDSRAAVQEPIAAPGETQLLTDDLGELPAHQLLVRSGQFRVL